jgi:2-keto-3-deoxy-L-rhamnonate aldolase RhmA
VPYLETLVHHNTQELFKHNLIDDDQTILLMSYLAAPEMFELHSVSPTDWFIIFKDYNENIS